jgi:hypothetical protein
VGCPGDGRVSAAKQDALEQTEQEDRDEEIADVCWLSGGKSAVRELQRDGVVGAGLVGNRRVGLVKGEGGVSGSLDCSGEWLAGRGRWSLEEGTQVEELRLG